MEISVTFCLNYKSWQTFLEYLYEIKNEFINFDFIMALTSLWNLIMQFLSGNPRNGLSADSMCIMTIKIVKFPREGCKIKKIFGLQHTYEVQGIYCIL